MPHVLLPMLRGDRSALPAATRASCRAAPACCRARRAAVSGASGATAMDFFVTLSRATCVWGKDKTAQASGKRMGGSTSVQAFAWRLLCVATAATRRPHAVVCPSELQMVSMFGRQGPALRLASAV